MSTTSDHEISSAAEAIPLSVPHLAGREWQYVRQCLDTGWISSAGSFVEQFERQIANCVGAKHAIATVNGTAALHVAMLLAGVQRDDEVLVPTLTFIASANAVCYTGARPVFIDVEPEYWQIDPNLVEDFLKNQCEGRNGDLYNRRTGKRVRAILVVHVLGHPVDMDPILELAGRFGLAVIEDAAESLGAKYKGRHVGAMAEIGCFSFNGNKTITTGGGGMIVTNDEQLAARAHYLTRQAKDDPLESIHHQIGFNYRLPNLLAAVGCAQLEQLSDHIAAKRRIHQRYRDELDKLAGVRVFAEAKSVFCTYWLSAIEVDADRFEITSRELGRNLRRQGIETRPLWQPLHCSAAHRESQAIVRGTAESIVSRCLCLPSSPGLCDAALGRTIGAIVAAAPCAAPG